MLVNCNKTSIRIPRLMARNKPVHVYNLGTRIGSVVSLTCKEVNRWTSRAQYNDIFSSAAIIIECPSRIARWVIGRSIQRINSLQVKDTVQSATGTASPHSEREVVGNLLLVDVTQLCVLRTFGGVDFSLVFICAQSVSEFLWGRLRAGIQFPVMPKRA
eukprot:COSAG02_NODE_1186_length_14006_cov_5.088948_7_plen_159_part_00